MVSRVLICRSLLRSFRNIIIIIIIIIIPRRPISYNCMRYQLWFDVGGSGGVTGADLSKFVTKFS